MVSVNNQNNISPAPPKLLHVFFLNGNKSETHKRTLKEAILNLVDNGCKWSALPHNSPKWSAVKSFYYRAAKSGLWERRVEHCHKVKQQYRHGFI